MVQEEFDILNIVAKEPFTSQRKISSQTGISLGQVNFLMKKFVAKGLIKLENQTSKSVQYHLTPKGMAALADRTLKYIRNSYSTVRRMTKEIIDIGKSLADEGYHIHIAGRNDEMMELAILALKEGDIPYETALPKRNSKVAVLYWEEEARQEHEDFTWINLLNL